MITTTIDLAHVNIFPNKFKMSHTVANKAACLLKSAIQHQGHATFVTATGASQFEFLEALVTIPGIDWSRTRMFHLDEYIGLPEIHPASFRKYLKERLIRHINPGEVHLIQGDANDLQGECDRLNHLISGTRLDVAFVGIGENGHLAFNDPPADFEVEDPYIIVDLNEACRKQQLGEGWFHTLEDVPQRAISMSIKGIMKAGAIICTVPDRRKAQAVRDCFTGEVSHLHPASILREHANAHLYLDKMAASLLNL